MNQLVLLGGSLVAILVLAGVAQLLKLGGGTIADEAAAIAAAEALLSGFEGLRAVVGSDGRAALVHGRDGSVALLKLHGAHVAVRRLAGIDAEAVAEGVRVHSGERRFGSVLIRGVRTLT